MHSTFDQQRGVSSVLKALEEIRNGRMVIMTDDEDRENEGDLILAAEFVTPEKINFMAREARGLICLALTPERVEKLKLPLMEDSFRLDRVRSTAFTVSIEARHGVTTGISAADRSQTIRVAVDANTEPNDIVVPGHVFPLRARAGGVLERSGHTEGSVDLANLAGLNPSAVICEIMNDDGTMARQPDLKAFAEKHNLHIVTISDIVNFRLMRDSLVEKVSSRKVQTVSGDCDLHVFKSRLDSTMHFAVTKGLEIENAVVDVRVHHQRPLLDTFASELMGQKSRIDYGMNMLTGCESGVFIYLGQSQPNADWDWEFEELCNANTNSVTRPVMDFRQVGLGAQILRLLGVRKMRVHAASPSVLRGLSGFELEVIETVLM
jgi:3,4-dihydroxy 2-butanone 4-phosphate synthase/GTP cyclohydrolase II